ncbi:MAG: hypothetical protein AAFV53_19775 [Myxococcota bacterium]
MFISLLSLSMLAPAAFAQSADIPSRKDLCEKIGGEWHDGICRKAVIGVDVDKLRFPSIESEGLFQVEVHIESEGWTCPMLGELYVYTSAGDFARAPLDVAVELYENFDESDALASELELDRTDSPLQDALDRME